MSTEELGRKLGEQDLESKTQGFWGLLLGIGIKYGLPSLTCIYLFYVIQLKDQILYSTIEKVTAALVESNNSNRENATAMNRLADAINRQNPSAK